MSQLEGGPVVILSPHFDDAVLSCWSVLTRSPDVTVVNVFTRALPTLLHEGELLTGARDSVARARERVAEDRAALALVGIEPHNLDLLEHLHWEASGPAPPGRLRSIAERFARRIGRPRPDAVEDRVREVAEAVAPYASRAARVYAPAAIGGHPDHEIVREVACRLARDGCRLSFYADQPYCYTYGWPHWVVGREPDPHLDLDRWWNGFLDAAGVDFADLRVEVVRLDGEHDDKVRALQLHASQFAVLESGANHRVSNPELTGWEVFWHGAQAADSGAGRADRRT